MMGFIQLNDIGVEYGKNHGFTMASMGKVMAWQNSWHSRVSDAWVLLYHHGKGHGMAKLIPHGLCHEVWVLSCCMSYPLFHPRQEVYVPGLSSF